jgi:ParB family chromosome partitioning protein
MIYSPLSPVDVSAIDASNRLRPVNPDRVAALAASMSEIGLQQPIIVRPHPDGSNRMALIAGGHRLAAAQLLGWPEIAAVSLDTDGVHARLIEIDENLIRNELSALDFAVSVAERKRLYEALYPETTHGGKREKRPVEGQGVNIPTWSRFSKDAAKRTGLSESTFQKAAGLMLRLSPEVIDAIRSTPLANNGGALKKLSYLAPEQQLGAAKALQAGQAKNLKGALVAAGFAPAPILSDPAYILIERWKDVLSRQSATMRRALIMEALRTVRPGEFTALANELAKRLPVSRQKQIAKALEETLAAYGEDA